LTRPPSFVVIHVTRIGDTLMTTPVLCAIAHAYPGSAITVQGHPKRIEVIDHLPFIARTHSLYKRTVRLRGWLGGPRYDYALVYGFNKLLVSYALRIARQVIAFRQQDERLNLRLHKVVDVPVFQSEHLVLQLLRLPAALGVTPAGLRLLYHVTEAERAWAEHRIAQDIPRSSHPLIGFQVASFPTKAYRDWPVTHFAELAHKILACFPRAHFLIYGGRGEWKRTHWLKRELKDHARLYAGQLSLRQTAALMSQTDCYVGVDTGPTHIMSTFDIPLVGLYHCFSPSRLLGPLEHPHFYPVDHPRPYPCATDVTMAEISVDAVFSAIERALASRVYRPM
jgi:heptosyltransferase-3